jgi:hypothetical protein
VHLPSLEGHTRTTSDSERQFSCRMHHSVVQDIASDQRLIELAGRAGRMDALKASLDDLKAGKVIPAADVLAERRQILDGKRGR